MFPFLGKPITLFKLLGFKVQIDLSWVFLALLVTWSLAEGLFPQLYQGLSPGTYWWMGVAGATGLFASLIFHELCHSLVARRYGIPMKGITLFIFGGVAQMDEEPPSAKSEFLMAIAGPLASIGLAASMYLALHAGKILQLPLPVVGVVAYLSFVNGLLAAFNLIPAFPLDGGRVLRALLWRWKNDIRWATRLASTVGAGFGLMLIALGVVNLLMGRLVLGIWWALIGIFLRFAAKASYFQLLSREVFEGEPIHRFMTPNPVSVPADLSVQEFVEQYVYTHLHDVFPVIQNSSLIGLLKTNAVSQIRQLDRQRRTVRDLMIPRSPENTIAPDTDAVKALSIMKRTGNSRLLVVDGDRLVGILALKDMLKFLSLKVDLEGIH